jgi:hypothetical protein
MATILLIELQFCATGREISHQMSHFSAGNDKKDEAHHCGPRLFVD